MSGFGDSQPSDGSQIDFIINMSARKVWVKAASSGSYVGGGDPTDASSTASFLLPTGTIYFGNVQYSGSDIITFGDDSTVNNSFYLPMDGNSLIGEDKSGRGNNWTPVNFGGSVALPKATGAKPILNTDGGGNVARPGVFGSEVGAYYAVTVASVGGGNRYHFDGVDRPNPTLTRGATYTFDQSDSTNSNHPLRFSTTSNGSHGGGSEYTDGVTTNGTPGSAGAYTKITVPHNSADTLYYYCTNHSNMGSSTSQITDETKADPYAWKNVLALPLVGSANDVSNQINSGSTTKTITNNGVNISSANSNFYGESNYWDGGTTDRLTVTYNSEFQFGTGDFCVEFWVNLSTSSGNQYFWDFDSNGGNFQYNGNVLSYSDGVVAGSGPLYSTGITLAVGKWHHLAVTRESSTAKIFVDGVMRATGTTAYNYNQTSVLDIGNGYNNSGYEITGYMQDFRIYKGVAKYTTDFVVPATSPDILPDTPSGVSGGSKLAKVTDGAVSFDGSGSDYLVVGDGVSTDLAPGTGVFTIEFYLYPKTVITSAPGILQWSATNNTQTSYTNAGFVAWNSTGSITLQLGASSITTGAGKVPMNKWSHIAIQRSTGNEFRLYVDGILITSDNSTLGNPDTSSKYLVLGKYYTGNNYALNGFISNFRLIKGTALYTSNFTPPTAPLTNVTNTKLLCCQSNRTSGAAAVSSNISGVNDGTVWSSSGSDPNSLISSGKRVETLFDGDDSSFINIAKSTDTYVIALDNQSISCSAQISLRTYYGNSTPTMRVTNTSGSTSTFTVTSGSSLSWYDFSYSGTIKKIEIGYIGGSGSSTQFAGFKVDSVVLKDPVGTFGNAAATNFNPFNTDINTVRGQETGYATLNPLDSGHSGGSITFSDGNLKAAFPSASGNGQAPATIYVSSGKWYCEYYLESVSDLTSVQYGIVSSGSKRASYIGKSDTTDQYGWEPEIDRAYNNGNNTTPTGKTFTSQWSVAAMALDLDNGTWKMFIDGVPTGTIYSGISGTYTFAIGDTMSSGYHTHTANYGQKPFKYAPPDGFQPLNNANTKPVKVIARPDQFVGVTTYTGNDGTQNVNIGIEPDLVWIKSRDATYDHALFDTVRGPLKRLRPNQTNAEGTDTTTLTSFDSNGFTTGSDEVTNKDDDGYVSWSWKAGGSKNTFNVDDVGYASAAAAGLTGGSITPSGASVGTKQGFSIIGYTGDNGSSASIAHGLNQKPTFFIVKRTGTGGNDWGVYHSALGATKLLDLNNGGAANTTSSIWNDTEPTSSVFTVGTFDMVNASDTYIAYLWHDVPGLQKFGAYNSNGSTDGNFVELGFRPAILWIKSAVHQADTTSWCIFTDKTYPNNPFQKPLYANKSIQEGYRGNASNVGTFDIDLLSNGFKLRTLVGEVNEGGANDTYVYCAWAEAPTVNLYGGGANAR